MSFCIIFRRGEVLEIDHSIWVNSQRARSTRRRVTCAGYASPPGVFEQVLHSTVAATSAHMLEQVHPNRTPLQVNQKVKPTPR
jgi:hypothetical protein